MTDTINGVKYVKILYPVMESTNTTKLKDYCENKNIIFQSMDVIQSGSFFKNPIAGANLLVPEAIVLEFNRMSFKKY